MKTKNIILLTFALTVSVIVSVITVFPHLTNSKNAGALEKIGKVESGLFEKEYADAFMNEAGELLIESEDGHYFSILKGESLTREDEEIVNVTILPLFSMYDEVIISTKHKVVGFQGSVMNNKYVYKVIFSNKNEEAYLSYYFDESTFINTFTEGYRRMAKY